MKIELEPPYSKVWDKGYLVTNSEGRRNVVLYNSPRDRTTTAYARYLLSVKLGRFLTDDEEADHIDENKANDVIENLQILAKSENVTKSNKRNGSKISKIKCPNCNSIFLRRSGLTQAVPCLYGKITCCSRECSANFRKTTRTREERENISRTSLLEVLYVKE